MLEGLVLKSDDLFSLGRYRPTSTAPCLPLPVNRLEIRNINVGNDHADLAFERQAGGIKVTGSGPMLIP